MENLLNKVYEKIQEVNLKKSNDLQTFNNEKTDIIEIFRGGSSLFKANTKDIDYIVIVNNFELKYSVTRIVENDIIYELFIFDKNEYIKTLKSGNGYGVSRYVKENLYGKLDFDFHIKEYEKQYKENVLKFLKGNLFNKNETFKQNKRLWWKYLTLKFIDNENYVITNEDKEKIIRWSNNEVTEQDKVYWQNVLKELESK
jgi:hypothetical protein